MRRNPNRINSLVDTFAEVLAERRRAFQQGFSLLLESVRTVQGDTADRRMQRIAAQLKQLGEDCDLMIDMAHGDFLTKIRTEAEALSKELADSRLASLLTAFDCAELPSLKIISESLLDRLIETTGAERGFVLLYIPESTEAEVIAARNFESRHLSLEEYDFSRTLLRRVLREGGALLLEDAANDPAYSRETSVIKFRLKSVLAAPLKQGDRIVGALYLENNTLPRAFDRDDIELIEAAARFTTFYLHHARLLPAIFDRDSRVFFDTSKASKEIMGCDPKIIALLEVINRIADSPATVLIEGETGTGKELVARALHYQSLRRDRPFVAINCAAIPENLLESELFGYEKGAFTGATQAYAGRIEQGNGGTVFLDEISEMAYPLQAKLLRFLQGGEFNRLGGKETIKADVRIVAATSKNLESLAQAGRFQAALYYRLNVIPVSVPPLRQRREDIPLLAGHFFSKFRAMYGKELLVEPEVYERLSEYDFSGNVRELENLMHRLVALASGTSIRIGDLPPEILQITSKRISIEKDPLFQLLHTSPVDLEDLRSRREQIKRVVAEQERQLAERVIQEAGGNLTEAARRLGVHRITLHNIVKGTKKQKP